MGAGALIGAIIGGAAFAARSTLLGTTLLSSVLMGAALGSIFDRRRAQPGSPTYEFGELMNTHSQAMPVPIVYGRVRVAGNIIYHRVSDDQKTLYMAVGLGEGPIQGVSDIRVNDTPISEIKGAEYRVYLGTPNQQADPWVHTGERWPYTAYIALKFEANEQISSTPTITCVVHGRKVPVWNGSEWVEQYSNNPAWVILDFLRSTRYGVGIENSRIDFDSFRAEAQYCDELVDDGKGGREPRFRLDYVIDYERSSLDAVEDMLATFRAFLLYSDGKLRLKVEKSEAPVYHFDMDNIVEGSFVYSKASRKDIPNQIRVEWIDPEADWERAEAVYDNEIDQDKRGEVYSRTISLFGITRPGQAGRMARFYHDSAFWANTFCEFRVGIDALHVEVGDVIQISHDVPGWDRKLFRVLEIAEEETDEATLRCREYVPAIYHDRGVPYQPGKETSLPNPVAPPPHVINLALTEVSRVVGDGTVVPVIRVTWTEPTAAFYVGAVVYWRRVGDSAWQRSQLSEAPSYDIVLAEPGQYEVRVVSENRNGIRAPFDTAPTATITVSTVIPANVTGLQIDFSGPDAVITWNPVLRAYRYRLRIMDPATDQIVRTEEVAGTSYRYTYAQNAADFGGNGSPSIKVSVEARNEAGNYSAQAAVVQATCPVPPQPTVTVKSDRAEIRWTVTSDVPSTWKSTTVSAGSFTQTAPVLSGVIDAESAGLSDGDLATVIVRFNDVFGRSSETREVQVTVKYIDKLAFARDLRAVELVSALPELPNPDYPQGAIVFLTTDNQLYRSTGTAWVVEVPAEVKDGSITTAKLAAGAVTSDKLAANSVTAGTIAAGAVSADAISANAIQADHIQNDTIESRHIKAEAIESKHIQAGAVESDHIKANAIEAQHIQSGAIEASHIKVGDPLDRAVKNVNASRLPNAVPPGAHLFHFDNSLQSTRGLRPLPGYVATLRPGEGRFGGAVAVEEETENLCPNPSFEVDVSGWTNQFGKGVFERDTSVSFIGSSSLKVVGSDEGARRRAYFTVGLKAGEMLTLSGYALSSEFGTAFARIEYNGGDYSWKPFDSPFHSGSGKWERVVVTGEVATSDTTAYCFIYNEGKSPVYWDAIQAEKKPFATSFVDGTRARGKLEYPQSIWNHAMGTFSAWVKTPTDVSTDRVLTLQWANDAFGPDTRFGIRMDTSGRFVVDYGSANTLTTAGAYNDGQWHHVVLTWVDGTADIHLYVDGERVVSASEPISVNNPGGRYRGVIPIGHRGYTYNDQWWNGLIDELLILPYAASDEEIRTWYELQAPFYDTDDRVAADLPGGHVITFDSSGMQMTPAGFPQRGMHLNGRMIGFWDINNVPAIGIGDVREMAAQLGSTMEYGLLLNQGEIRASQSVLQQSFADASVTRDAIAPGAVVGDAIPEGTIVERQIAERSVGISRLGEEIMVPNIFQPTLLRYQSNSEIVTRVDASGRWLPLTSWSVPKRDNNNGYLMEIGRVEFDAKANNPSVIQRIRLLMNGSVVATFDSLGTSYDTFEFTFDARSMSDGNINFALQGYAGSTLLDYYTRNRRVYQNEQLPLRWGRPAYTLPTAGTGGCYTHCQVTCQSGCQSNCQANCQQSCQSDCQTSCQEECQASCQSTCQNTSQGGGGCLREGTLVTIWDPDVQEYREIPVEQLQPGMILPGYDPETDTVIHGELIQLEDALFSNRFIRIHTDVGPSIDVTYSQPFDVMADVGQGWRWYKVQARFLKPGMKMVRPFDDPEKRIATITKVEEVREYMVHFWHPRTTTGRYTAAGYADQHMKW